MKKFFDFYKVFDRQFWILVGALLVLTAISFGLQSMLFRTDAMPEFGEIRIGELTFGKILNIAVFVAIFGFTGWLNIRQNIVAQGKKIKMLIISICLSLGMIMFMYISVIAAYPWWIMVLCFVAIMYCEYVQHRQKIDTGRTYVVVAVALAYCVGAYLAMLLNKINPTIDNYGAFVLMITTLSVWFWPAGE